MKQEIHRSKKKKNHRLKLKLIIIESGGVSIMLNLVFYVVIGKQLK